METAAVNDARLFSHRSEISAIVNTGSADAEGRSSSGIEFWKDLAIQRQTKTYLALSPLHTVGYLPPLLTFFPKHPNLGNTELPHFFFRLPSFFVASFAAGCEVKFEDALHSFFVQEAAKRETQKRFLVHAVLTSLALS